MKLIDRIATRWLQKRHLLDAPDNRSTGDGGDAGHARKPMPHFASRTAVKTLTSAGSAARWLSGKPVGDEGWEAFFPGEGADRVYRDSPSITLAPKFRLPSKASIFAAGSCFAREIEWALFHAGKPVLSWTPDFPSSGNDFHRYTTHAIINDFIFALEGGWSEENVVQAGKRFVDYSGHGGFDSREEAIAARRLVIEQHRNIIHADVLFVTLGLVEAWYDRQTQTYANTPPFGQFLSDRFELRITDFAENLAALSRFIATLRKHRPGLKVILTVSPVPLKETFSGQDVLVANSYSKSVLRAVAQEICQHDPLTDYFPSYEMVMLADPKAAWFPDHRHVRREFVAKIVSVFSAAYMGGGIFR